jgi:phospholipase/carboxylesterase
VSFGARPVLRSRPASGPRTAVEAGTAPIGHGGLVHVPAAYDETRPTPLIVTLHGAGGTAQHGLDHLLAVAEDRGALLVSPRATRSTWDAVLGGFGPDVTLIDTLLAQVFERYSVDPMQVAVSGFSDGASYALSLGLANGDLFTSVLAFSPGFIAPARPRGSPAVFVTHGIADAVLPIDRCSRRIVPALRRAGYRVEYREFVGPHTVPPHLARAGVDWALGGPAHR